ncbi:MAG: hypothetical protein AB1716_19045 [Planctomycetota bacterium]
MPRFALSVSVLVLISVVWGCQSQAPTRDAGQAAVQARGDLASAAPLDYRKEELRLAMRGLQYDTGRVVVDEAFAATIAERGDVAAAEAEYARGAALLDENARIEAIGAFTRAVLIAPGEARFYTGLGWALLWKGKDAEAEAAFRTGLDLAPDSVELRFLLADTLNRRGDLAGSITQFQALLVQDPQHAEAHGRLAVLLYYAGDLAAAGAHAQAAERLGQPVAPQLLPLLKGELLQVEVRDSVDGVGPQVRIDVTGGTFASNETTIATTDMYPREAVAAWNDWRASTGSEIIRMGVGVTLDGGATWTDFVVRPPPANQSSVEGDPMTCYDQRTGTLWVGAISFAGNGGVYVARKNSGSATFQPSVMARATSGADKCWMAAGPLPGNPNSTRVYIGYNQGMLRSDDLGNTWAGPVSMGSGLGFLPRVGPNGEVYVAYWALGSQMYLKRSLDGGLSFTTHLVANRLDTWSISDTSRFPGQFRIPILGYLAVDPQNGTLYYVYFDTTNIVGGNRNVDLWFTKSTNQGTSWSTPRVINADASPPGDQFWPWLEVDNRGRIHLCFWDSRNTVQNDGVVHGMFDVYYMTSRDGGATWTEARLTPASFDSYNDGLNRSNQFLGDYNGLTVGTNRVYPCYVSTQNGDTDVFTNVITIGLLGDLNCDDVVNFDDINPFVLALTDPAAYAIAYPNCPFENRDINGDGLFNFDDINPFVALLGG